MIFHKTHFACFQVYFLSSLHENISVVVNCHAMVLGCQAPASGSTLFHPTPLRGAASPYITRGLTYLHTKYDKPYTLGCKACQRSRASTIFTGVSKWLSSASVTNFLSLQNETGGTSPCRHTTTIQHKPSHPLRMPQSRLSN